jgi:hypothetical protein
MITQKVYPLGIAALLSLCCAMGVAHADMDTSNLSYYMVQNNEQTTVEKSISYMRRFLPKEDISKIKPSRDNFIHYVSEIDVNTTFEQNLVTGDIAFSRNFARYIGDFAPQLPDDDKAVQYAVDFLRDSRLLPANQDELKVSHVGGLRSNTVSKDGKPGPVIDKLKTVSFSRTLDGLPVIGSGSKMVVNLGDGGEVIGVIRRWRELDKPTRLDVAEVLTEDEALASLKKLILEEFGEDSRWDIINAQLAYYDNNGYAIQPVYAFQTKIQLADLKLPPIEYMGVVSAMRKPIEELNLTQVDDRALKLIQKADPSAPDESRKEND